MSTLPGRRIPIPLPNTGGLLVRKRRSTCLRSVIVIFLLGCAALQVYILTVEQPQKESHLKDGLGLSTMPVNDSVAAILQNVPLNLHKYLAAKPKNVTTTGNNHLVYLFIPNTTLENIILFPLSRAPKWNTTNCDNSVDRRY